MDCAIQAYYLICMYFVFFFLLFCLMPPNLSRRPISHLPTSRTLFHWCSLLVLDYLRYASRYGRAASCCNCHYDGGVTRYHSCSCASSNHCSCSNPWWWLRLQSVYHLLLCMWRLNHILNSCHCQCALWCSVLLVLSSHHHGHHHHHHQQSLQICGYGAFLITH